MSRKEINANFFLSQIITNNVNFLKKIICNIICFPNNIFTRMLYKTWLSTYFYIILLIYSHNQHHISLRSTNCCILRFRYKMNAKFIVGLIAFLTLLNGFNSQNVVNERCTWVGTAPFCNLISTNNPCLESCTDLNI